MWLRWLLLVAIAVALGVWWYRTAAPSVRVATSDADLNAARRFLASDADGFVATFTDADYHARGTAADRRNYSAMAAGGVRAPTPLELGRLRAALARTSSPVSATIVVVATNYEGGLPHTRGAYIFVSPLVLSSPGLAQVLDHELTHIAQRFRPADARSWATAHGYVLRRDRGRHPLSRANPDLDGAQWDGPNGAPVAFIYRGPRPINLTDGETIGGKYEHPYEAQAYG